MHQALAILAILLAIALVPLDSKIRRSRRREPAPLQPIERITYIIFLISLALMTLSSILMLAIGQSMHGWMLILHMSVAPLFSIAIAAVALQWSHHSSALLRLILLAAFVTIITAVFMMMTWFGSDWQRILLNTHRVSSMVLLVAVAVQAGRLLLAGNPDAARPRD